MQRVFCINFEKLKAALALLHMKSHCVNGHVRAFITSWNSLKLSDIEKNERTVNHTKVLRFV
jgi:hypothetical protein